MGLDRRGYNHGFDTAIRKHLSPLVGSTTVGIVAISVGQIIRIEIADIQKIGLWNSVDIAGDLGPPVSIADKRTSKFRIRQGHPLLIGANTDIIGSTGINIETPAMD